MCVILPNFIKIGHTVTKKYVDLTSLEMVGVRHLGFVNLNYLTIGANKKPILRQCTKFRKDQSNRCGAMAIFVIFKMAVAAILDFQKLKILTVDPL